jgi:hypothetical protein
MTYDPRRLITRNLIARIPHSHRYRVTDHGLDTAKFLTCLHDRVLRTGLAELATARIDRDDLESVLRLIWPYTAKLYAGIQLSQRRQAARDDAVFNELIARLDEEDDDSDG